MSDVLIYSKEQIRKMGWTELTYDSGAKTSWYVHDDHSSLMEYDGFSKPYHYKFFFDGFGNAVITSPAGYTIPAATTNILFEKLKEFNLNKIIEQEVLR